MIDIKNVMLTKTKYISLLLIIGMFMLNGCRAEDAKSQSDLDLKTENIPVSPISPSAKSEKNEVEDEDDEANKMSFVEDNYEIAQMYTAPILMHPKKESVDVVWFTEAEDADNEVLLYELGEDNKPTRAIKADTTLLSRMRGGKDEDTKDDQTIVRTIYRHSATVDGLPLNDGSEGSRIHYCVRTGNTKSEIYTLCAQADKGTPVKILITSDHQNKDMCAANIEKAYETVPDIDAVFVDGDMADVADRAYDWFDSDNAFFKVMQGRASHEIEGVTYKGAPILQNAPIYTAIGNHEVMGVYSTEKSLSEQFNNPTTREYAKKLYEVIGGEDETSFIEDNSFNTISYDELFGNKSYYTFDIGDARVIVLEMARIWRLPTIGFPGKYSEIPGMGEDTFGYGQFIFEPIDEGSEQLKFLKKELADSDFKDAKLKVVMYHFDNHSLGSNSIPAYTNPVAKSAVSPVTGQDMVVYDYPIEEDHIAKYVEPLLEDSKVNLLITGHSHIWNRFITGSGMNILQSSNVGNNYGGFVDAEDSRGFAPSAYNKDDLFYSIRDKWDTKNYVMRGDPQGLKPEYPNVTNLPDNLPYLASNTITAFSILDTGRGVVDSYYYDTTKPSISPVLFDSFSL